LTLRDELARAFVRGPESEKKTAQLAEFKFSHPLKSHEFAGAACRAREGLAFEPGKADIHNPLLSGAKMEGKRRLHRDYIGTFWAQAVERDTEHTRTGKGLLRRFEKKRKNKKPANRIPPSGGPLGITTWANFVAREKGAWPFP